MNSTPEPQTARYRKRPVEVEARRWDGTAEGATRIIDWILGHGSTATYMCSNPDRCAEHDGDTPHSISIRTLEGVMAADLGDWVIREPFPTGDRQFYPCKPDIFEQTYEPAAAVSVAVPPTQERRDRYAALAEDLRYVLGYTGPRHAHAKPGVWDTSGKPCGHCARLAVAQRNLATYDADPVADAEQAALRTRVARLATALGEAVQHVGGSGEVSLQMFERWRAERDAQPDDGQADTRAAVLREAAEAVLALDYDVVVGEVGDQNISDIREAWNLGTIDATDLLRRMAAEAQQQPEVVHGCPPDGSGLTPCCGHTPFELPRTDRMSTDPAAVTCAPAVVSQPDEEATR